MVSLFTTQPVMKATCFHWTIPLIDTLFPSLSSFPCISPSHCRRGEEWREQSNKTSFPAATVYGLVFVWNVIIIIIEDVESNAGPAIRPVWSVKIKLQKSWRFLYCRLIKSSCCYKSTWLFGLEFFSLLHDDCGNTAGLVTSLFYHSATGFIHLLIKENLKSPHLRFNLSDKGWTHQI